MKQLFLRSIKVNKKLNTGTVIQENDNLYDDNFYGEYKSEDNNLELYGFRCYNISTNCIVSLKEARTAIEEKKPFIISKAGKKHTKAEERDTIYKTSTKLKISNNSVERVGFIIADSRYKEINLRKNNKKYKGILNDSFMICRKKPLNYKKIGYLELQNITPNKYSYVEVVSNRGYKWLMILIIILALIAMLIHNKNWDNWKFNWNKLKIYKTEEITEYKANELSITFNASPVLKDGVVNLNLLSEYQNNITYTFKIFDENKNLLYESNSLKAGEGVSNIELITIPTIGEHKCEIICDYYLLDVYSGTLDSDFILQVK